MDSIVHVYDIMDGLIMKQQAELFKYCLFLLIIINYFKQKLFICAHVNHLLCSVEITAVIPVWFKAIFEYKHLRVCLCVYECFWFNFKLENVLCVLDITDHQSPIQGWFICSELSTMLNSNIVFYVLKKSILKR